MDFKQGEQLLEEMGTTSKELDAMWGACVIAGHKLITQLDKSGVGWRDLNPSAIKTLPREYYKIECAEKPEG